MFHYKDLFYEGGTVAPVLKGKQMATAILRSCMTS